ncbi:MAG: hypothetical protein AMJ92_03080 [candidate division Zixibacteria bacterium SM23_81]|nr:MAG: hypothetical protein AMJ92_03080 [candidate division Zixibacteria bacterium SM23_81]
MLFLLPWKGKTWDLIPAVNHMGTGWLQAICRELYSRYYWIVKKFGEATGIPVLMNTSFNLRGKLIVSSPAGACNTFSKSEIDILVMSQYLVNKEAFQRIAN